MEVKSPVGVPRYSANKRRLRWPLLVAIAALHLVLLYAIARVFAPDITQSVESDVIAAFDVTPALLKTPQNTPLPQAASTGDAAASGAQSEGDGTGAAGEGLGTGSGLSGAGRGGVAVTKPEHISGQINNARDYDIPTAGREARRGTEVIVRVIVGIDGRARNCTIYRPSPDAEADQRTCELVEDRLGFRPAQDANGNPVAAPFYWRQRWF